MKLDLGEKGAVSILVLSGKLAAGGEDQLREAIDTLRGRGPGDLVDLIMELGSDMLLISGIVSSRNKAKSRIADNLANQKGLKRLVDLIIAKGGDPSVVNNPKLLPQPTTKIEVKSETHGYVSALDSLEVGLASKILGAGRKTKDDPIDYSVGIYLKKKIGDHVKAGDPLAVFYSDGDDGEHTPVVRNIFVSNVTSQKSKYAMYFDGYERSKISNVNISSCEFSGVQKGSIIKNIAVLNLDKVYINGQIQE